MHAWRAWRCGTEATGTAGDRYRFVNTLNRGTPLLRVYRCAWRGTARYRAVQLPAARMVMDVPMAFAMALLAAVAVPTIRSV